MIAMARADAVGQDRRLTGAPAWGHRLFQVGLGRIGQRRGFEPLPQFLRRRQMTNRSLQPQHAHASGRQHAVLEGGVTPRLVFIAAAVSVDLEGKLGLPSGAQTTKSTT